MADIVIFGTGDYARQAHYYLTTDSPHTVVAFSVTSDWLKHSQFLDLPLIPFEELEETFPPKLVGLSIPMSGRRMNQNRERIYVEAKKKGYTLISYVSSRAVVSDNKIGDNCFILPGAVLQPFAEIGNNTIIRCLSNVGHDTIIGDHVFVSASVSISGRCHIKSHCYISANAVIDANVTLAQGTLAGLSSVVTRDTELWSIYTGQPASRREGSSADLEFLER